MTDIDVAALRAAVDRAHDEMVRMCLAREAAVERVRNLRDEWHDGLRDVAVYETGYELSQVLTETIEEQA